MKYEEKISDKSIWAAALPTQFAAELPFYAIECGYFFAEPEYGVSRRFHDSFLLLFTVRGCGKICSGDKEFLLDARHAALLDCRAPHSYKSEGGGWDFFWVHFNGCAAMPMYNALYPDSPHAIRPTPEFYDGFAPLINTITDNDVIASIDVSQLLHSLLNMLIKSVFINARDNINRPSEIETALEFMRENYSENITVDDIIQDIHLSKYHFIRLFKRIMGTTPYSWLTGYRINISKQLLRTTNKSVADIAADCGYVDTSNYINHFKKSTGITPVQYRRDFK